MLCWNCRSKITIRHLSPIAGGYTFKKLNSEFTKLQQFQIAWITITGGKLSRLPFRYLTVGYPPSGYSIIETFRYNGASTIYSFIFHFPKDSSLRNDAISSIAADRMYSFCSLPLNSTTIL